MKEHVAIELEEGTPRHGFAAEEQRDTVLRSVEGLVATEPHRDLAPLERCSEGIFKVPGGQDELARSGGKKEPNCAREQGLLPDADERLGHLERLGAQALAHASHKDHRHGGVTHAMARYHARLEGARA